MDWNKIKQEYIRSHKSYRQLAEKYGCSESTLRKRAAKEHWSAARNSFGTKKERLFIEKTAEKTAEKEADAAARLVYLADRVLDKVEAAIDELDMHLTTSKNRTKIIEYNHTERPDKPTKEIIKEQEEIIAYTSIVDKDGLKKVTSALRDVKDLLMVKSDLDVEEQKARIENIRKQSADEEKEQQVTVVLSDEVMQYVK